ncbi:conserved Plasmodium protein, unknown function [Plasmodium malariae]|uniref:Uncharacterized protein n=1 Tax=Plasmodium malariae TaxID=5858 RepID=A0A1C3KBV5_PLAMA|nr:conserved Plasmodium protein, unknown function [Plasmodium malariae]
MSEEDKGKNIKISKTFCSSDDGKGTSLLEMNNVRVQSYTRNVRIEDLKYLRSIEALTLSNFYLLYVYLKDIYFIFLNFVIFLNREEKMVLNVLEESNNAFLFNTKIQEFDVFFECIKRYMEDKKQHSIVSNIGTKSSGSIKSSSNSNCIRNIDNHSTNNSEGGARSNVSPHNVGNKKEECKKMEVCKNGETYEKVPEEGKRKKKNNNGDGNGSGNGSGNGNGNGNGNGSGNGNGNGNGSGNGNGNGNGSGNGSGRSSSCIGDKVKEGGHFDYVNELLSRLYSEEEIKFLNIDRIINDKVKKENILNKSIKINNNVCIYKLSYLYFNDKLKRIRLDYIFNLILFNKKRNKKENTDNGAEQMKQSKNGDSNRSGYNSGSNYYYIYEGQFLLYLSHFKYYIFSFFLYSYVKYAKCCKNIEEGDSNRNDSGNTGRYNNRREDSTKRVHINNKGGNDMWKFLYNEEDNMKNILNVVSYILNFVNNVLYNLDIVLKREKIDLNENKKWDKKEQVDMYTSEFINDILKNIFSFKYINLDHLDFALSCIILLNIRTHNYNVQFYFYLNNKYESFFHLFRKYNTSICLWNNRKTLRSANYFRFFEDLKLLSIIEKCCLFLNLKNIRLEYIYNILYAANNRNKFSVNIKLIDECLNFYNIKRTIYFLTCLGMEIKNERIFFNMSNRERDENKLRCFLLDNKDECIKSFSKVYEECIDDYTYIIYQEKIFEKNKCFFKYDLPSLIYFAHC